MQIAPDRWLTVSSRIKNMNSHLKLSSALKHTRRTFFCALILGMALLMAAPSAQADPAADAKASLKGAIDQVLNLIKDPAFSNSATRESQIEAIDSKIREIFDFSEFSSRTVGRNWKTFTPEQQNQFIDAFAQLLRATYIDKVEGYNGEEVKYLGETVGTKGDKVEVDTSVSVKTQEAPIKVSYRMLNKSRWVVYDVVIEGVSLVQNYRTQFNELLQKGNAEDLIAKVNARAQELREQNKTGSN